MNTMSKTLQRIADRDKRVQSYEFDGELHWLHLCAGYRNELTETHSCNGLTVAEVREELSCVRSCHRECCGG